ncbi:hypothetical protein [Streptomyces sp. ID05-04B]|uniref:hypothetical protein n=1 Tax=Streptomyces sp. ID05-04B TaxID=3028661 RepID=UPI0039F73A88
MTAAGCKEQTSGAGSGGAGATAGAGKAGGGAALAAAESLPMKGRAPKTGYDREQFGSAWADTDSNSCDTRVISMLRRAIEPFAQFIGGVVGCAH